MLASRSITSSGFYSIIYESCQLFIQLTKIEKSKRVTLHHTMLKILWPLCMLKVPLCWWLVASVGVNKQGFMCGRCPDFGRDTGTGNTLCRVSSTPLTTLAPSAYKQCLALPPHHAQCHAPAPGATPATVSSVLPRPITRLTCSSSGCYSSL